MTAMKIINDCRELSFEEIEEVSRALEQILYQNKLKKDSVARSLTEEFYRTR